MNNKCNIKLEVGFYVRTDMGEIYKITTKNVLSILNKYVKIVKSSRNIIDLIEVGDIVNDNKIFDISIVNNVTLLKTYTQNCSIGWFKFENNDIKSILTKEQYEMDCFRIESQEQEEKDKKLLESEK